MPIVSTGHITITDIKDTVGLVLTNEAVVVAAAPDGTVASLSGVATTASVLLGGVDDSANWALTAGTPSGMTGTLSGKTYTVTGVSADTAYVDLTASRTGYASLTKRFSVSKSKQGVTGAKGADGVSPITVTLSNSAHTVPTDSAGNNGNFTGCNTTLNVFNGITNDSANWTVTAAATNLTGSLSGKTYTVTALSADVGYVDLTAARSGYTSQTARFTVSKSKTGAAGQTPTTYWMVRSASAIKKSAAGAYTPASITFTGKSQTGTAAPANYAGRFVISTSTDGTTWTAAYTSAANESSKSYTPPAGVSAVKAALYLAGGTSTLLDEEVIPVVVDGTDGAKGDTGAKGDQGPSVTVTANRAMSFTSTDGTLDTSQADIVFTAATSGITSPTYAWTFTGLQTNPTASTTATQTVTAAQFGTSRSATVTCTVGTYKQTLTIVRLEKSTADAGATVGATWGTNVGSIPANISTAGSTPTVDLRNNQIGLNASGQLYGVGAGNGTTVSNAQISVDTATGVIGGIGTGAGTAVANSQVAFSARQTWEFRGSAEGWVAANSSLATSTDTLTLTATAGNPQLGLTGLSIPGATYNKVRVRLRRVSGSGWRGALLYGTAAHNYSESYKKVLLDPVASTSFVVIEFDMADLTAGGTDWKSNTITSMRLDLGNVAGDAFEIDWISVGKYGHDVDLVLSASSQIIAGTNTNGVILDAASKSLQVMTGGNERVRLGNQPTAVNGSAYGMVVKDTSGNVVFDSRNNVGIVGNQTHDNYNLGDSSTNPFWNSNTNGVGNVAIGALALRCDGLAQSTGRSYNVAIGYQALRYTTVGTNIAIGNLAGRGNPAGFSGGDNTVIGYNAMVWGTTATKNVAIGRGALRETTSGSENTAVGYLSQFTGTDASRNTSLGSLSLRVATGSDNTSIGHNSGYSLNTGNSNTFVGKDAGYTITTGSGNTLIGYQAYPDANQSNQTIIKSGAGVVLKHSGTLLETEHNISSGGNITASGTVKGNALTVEGTGPLIRFLDTDVTQSNFWVHVDNSKFYVLTDYDYDGNWDAPTPLVLDNATTTANIYGHKAWTAGNDGVNSGLDADLLDGQHGSYYLSWANLTGKPTTLAGYGITDAASSSHSHTMPASGAWFNGGYMSIRSDGVMQAGKYLDWHNAGTDTDYVGRTWTDANGNLTHSAGLKVKGTGGLGYAFGGAVTQLTSRDTGVRLDTPSGTITLFSTTVTAGTMNKFTLTNSCITALDVVVVGVRASNSGTFNVFVNRTNAGVCDIVVQNLVTVATAQAVHINFAVIKGANA